MSRASCNTLFVGLSGRSDRANSPTNDVLHGSGHAAGGLKMGRPELEPLRACRT